MRTVTNMLLLLLGLVSHAAWAQKSDSARWAFEAEADLYYYDGETLLLPIFKADKDWLHLESRYNYEGYKTFSGWVGYNFSGGKQLSYTITPMAGIVTGQTNGWAGGLELTLGLGKFELYSESEYLFDASGKENNFFYTWTDLTFSPQDWWWVGLSGQRTALYQTEVEIQRGFILGAGVNTWEFSLYTYNLGLSKPLFLLSIVVGF